MSDRVRASRKRFERSLDDLGAAIDRELGWAPRFGRWIVPLVAGAVGLAAGIVVRRNLPKLRDRH